MTPILYDPLYASSVDGALTTRGRILYDEQFRKDPKKAVFDDGDIVRDALRIALEGSGFLKEKDMKREAAKSAQAGWKLVETYSCRIKQFQKHICS